MFHLTVFGWILFRAPDMVSFATYVRRLATAWDPAAFAAAGPAFVTLLAAAGPLAAYEFWIFRRGDLMAMRAAPAAVRAAVYLGIWFSLTLAAPTTARLFFYFQF